MSYEIGKVYVWRVADPIFMFLNGIECQVVSGKQTFGNLVTGKVFEGWVTDTTDGFGMGIIAELGDLIEKRPPTGEKSVLELFQRERELEPA